MNFIKDKTVIFVANRAFALYSSRKLLMKKLIDNGWKVIALTTEDKYSNKLKGIGVVIEKLNVNRGGFSITEDHKTFFKILSIYKKYKPDLIHQFHAKPIIMGNFAKMLVSPNSKIVNTITGLGYSFVAGGITKKLASIGYKFFLSGSSKTIFQNRDDMQLFLDNNWLENEEAELIVSSGINIEKFDYVNNKPDKSIKIFMASRLLWQKGVKEFVEAAKIVKKEFPDVQFELGGEIDQNHPDAVPESWIEDAVNKNFINYLGYVNNMDDKLKEIYIFVLPSFYREGVPRVLLEASATGKAIITTDSPGCREAVIENKTGKLVKPQSSQDLANAIIELVKNKDLITEMGRAGRERIESEFDIKMITEKYIDVYRKIGFNI